MVKRRALAALVLVTMAALLAACTDEPPTLQPPLVSGTWTLTAVNNQPLPRTIAVLLGGGVRAVVDGEIVVRSRGRLDDIKHITLVQGGVRLEDLTDTLTSPFSASESGSTVTLLVRRFGLLATDDWVDTATVSGNVMTLRARYLEPVYRNVQRVTLTYERRP
jgi:hypothetical protein